MKKMFVVFALLLCVGNGVQADGAILNKIAQKGNTASKQLAAVLLLELYSTKLFTEQGAGTTWSEAGQSASVTALAALEELAVKKESSLRGLVNESNLVSTGKYTTAAQVLADYDKIYFSFDNKKTNEKVVYGTTQKLPYPGDLKV